MPYLQLPALKELLTAETKRYRMERFTDLPGKAEGGARPDARKKNGIKFKAVETGQRQRGDLHSRTGSIADFAQTLDSRKQ